jgi:glycosyltransferase involved in cell wall biosynthesis
MRVVILPSWYPRDAADSGGIFFREQAVALARAGLKVTVLSPQRVSLRALLERRRAALRPIAGLDESLQTYIGPPRMAWLDAMIWRRVAGRLYEDYVHRHGVPDVLHAHSLMPAGAFAVRLPARVRVLTEHSTAFLGPDAARLATAATSTFSAYDVRIAVSQHLQSTLQSLAEDGGPWDYIPNLIDTEFFAPSKWPGPRIRVLTVSNLIARKRVDLLVRAFDAAFADSDAELAIGGDGEERDALTALAASLRSGPRIKFLGGLTRDQVKAEMDQCSFFVLASRGETFGVVLIEALSMGRPVVTTDSGGPASIVSSENGLLVPVDNPNALSRALAEMARSRHRYDGPAIRRDCVARFSERAVTSVLTRRYEQALRHGPTDP